MNQYEIYIERQIGRNRYKEREREKKERHTKK